MTTQSSAPLDATVTLCSRVRPAGGAPLPPGRLMVIEAGSSAVIELPRHGVLLIGRAPDAQVRLQDPLVSRHHARIEVHDGEPTLTDLGSHNGTRVNGERLDAPRRLLSGDVISLCEVTVLYSRPAGQAMTRPIFNALEPLQRRLEEEAERALHTRRPTALLCISGETLTVARRQELATLLGPFLRLEDVMSWVDGGALFLMRPDCDEEEAQTLASELFSCLSAFAPLRIGGASCPADGYDVDALLDGARSAARQAEPGCFLPAARALTKLRIGDRSVVVADPAMVRLYALIERLCQSDLPVLVCGETGTGKEMAAQALHFGSKRKAQRLVSINCAALAESLAESELFGHEKGAFSGAVAQKVGLLESAGGGTVFLDEIGELPLSLQAKLLRALETRRVMRVGDTRERTIDIRIIAATNRRLPDEVAAGRFRQDLYFRLSTAVLTLPPLRERQRELPILARTFLAEACARAEREPLLIAPATMDVLLRYRWPGNLRELRNVMDYVATVVSEPVVEPQHLPEPLAASIGSKDHAAQQIEATSLAQLARTVLRLPAENKLDAVEAALVTEAMRLAQGNKSAAARLLGVHRRVVERRLDKHGGTGSSGSSSNSGDS